MLNFKNIDFYIFKIQMAEEERRRSAPLMRLKKLYVMAALLVRFAVPQRKSGYRNQVEEYHTQTRAKAAEKNADESVSH